jgi:branched-chain amino acid transport system ATP-binding protein
VDVHVGAGEAVAILGSNGAGKSTLLNSVAGLIRPTQGSIRFEGEDLVGLGAHGVVARGVAAVPEVRHLFGPLSVQENLALGAFPKRARENSGAVAQRILQLFPRLAERRRQAVRTLSGGEQQMVAIGRALMSQPKLLLLDEPSLGLSPLLASELFQALERITREDGVSVLLVEQNARRALKIVRRAYLLSLGRVAGHGDAASLGKDPVVAESYLGL